MNGAPPGLAGFLMARQQRQQEDTSQLQQAAGLMGLQQAMEKARRQQVAEQELAALGPQPPQEALAQWAARHSGPEKVLQVQQASLDREAAREVQRQAAEHKRETDEKMINLRYDMFAQQVVRDDQRQALEKRRADDLAESKRRHEETMRLLGGMRQQPISTSEVVDPKDQSRMLKINTREYKGGTLGEAGVIGIAGKEPGAAKREEKEGQGKELLKTEIDNMREHYRVLNEAAAIPSSERGTASNVQAWARGSTAGQLGGRMIGSKEQDARNQIQSARLRIMNAIKNATGMSAQQLNSNVELKTWLDSLTSLTGSYESNIGILDSLESAFLKPKGDATGGVPAGVDPKVWDAMTPQEKALWKK